ncbi:MAG TPA: PAS domain-containing protein, partial [Candidatus Ozemobacteraceae bacterium]|nr:PAS domain-containing protein [Candidatus Ozemobacteraceae bacterium]
LAAVEAHLSGKTSTFDIVFRFRTKNDDWMWIRGRGRIIERDAGGKPIRMIGTHTDCTKQMRAEMALRKSEERFQKMLGDVPDMVSIHDCDMNVLYSNWQGYASVPADRRVCGDKCYRIYRGRDTQCPDCLAQKVFDTGKPVQTEAHLPDGRWVDLRVIPLLDDQGRVELFVEWVRDITDQKKALEEREKLQSQLAQSQKMESIGRLAGGVAHDFNNMLGVILGHTDLILSRFPPDDQSHADLQEISKAAER